MSEKKNILKPIHTIGLLCLVLIFGTAIFLAIRFVRMKQHTDAMPSISVLQPFPDQTLIIGLSSPVRVLAASKEGVSSLEWYLDGTLAGRVAGDGDELSGIWEWVPQLEGAHQLSFLAYAENGAMGLVSLKTAVLPGADVDGDGVLDELDACPSEAGPAANSGCLLEGDEDGDGLVGEMDACPDDAGFPEYAGCPEGAAPDRDGDGIPDFMDRCADESGRPDWYGCLISAWSINTDGDELPDFLDDCPTEYGSRDSGGCPLSADGDPDGDSVPDASDSCPDIPGPPSADGCPISGDRDGDGLVDEDDRCPDEAGPVASGGCPAVDAASDADMDGVPDSLDLCPDEIGLLEYSGCPMPGDSDGDGVPDDDDRCADLPGSSFTGGCPFIEFPWIEYYDQFRLLPRFASLFEREIISSDTDEEPGRGSGGVWMDDVDGDGVLDEEDDCPDRVGRPYQYGCPFLTEGDRDADNVPDDQDECIDRAGTRAGNGCPDPDEYRRIYLEVLNFMTTPNYSKTYCFGGFEISNEPLGTYRQPSLQRIPESGYIIFPVSRNITWDRREDYVITVDLHCWGQPDDLSAFSEYLGEIFIELDYFFWDSAVRKARGAGPSGMFEIWYRLKMLSWYSM